VPNEKFDVVSPPELAGVVAAGSVAVLPDVAVSDMVMCVC